MDGGVCFVTFLPSHCQQDGSWSCCVWSILVRARVREWFVVLPKGESVGGVMLSYTRETQSTFYESFELRSFPFDNQLTRR